MRIRAVIIEGEADEATLATIRQAMESPELSILFAAPRMSEIVKRVAYETGLPIAEIAGQNRRPAAFRARCAASLVARQITGKSTTQIGIALGNRDNSTIIHALRRTERFMAEDPAFRLLIARVTEHFDREQVL